MIRRARFRGAARPARDLRRLQDDGGDPVYDTVHPAEFGVRGCCCGDCHPEAYARWHALRVRAWGTDDRSRWPG